MKLGTNTIQTTQAHANIDAFYGPYESIQIACERIPERYRLQGLTIGIIDNGKIVEYQWKTNNVSTYPEKKDTDLQNEIQRALTAEQQIINTKQDNIADLETIRSGAAAGATAQQPATTLGEYGITDAYTKSEGLTLENTIGNRLDTQDAAIELLNGSEVIVVDDHTVVTTPDSQKIYRQQGTTSYTDWMYQDNTWKKIATYDFPGVDDEPTAGSNNLVNSGSIQNELALGTVYDVSAKNPTAGPNNDGKWESLSTLLLDANLDTLIPTAYRKGGMSIKFIQSTNNEYVQFRLMPNSWSSNVANWERYNDVTTSNQSNSDFDIADDEGNILVRIAGGHIKTKEFDSSKNSFTKADMAKVAGIEEGAQVNDVVTNNTTDADLTLSDENNNIIVMFKEGHIRTKNFNSSTVQNTNKKLKICAIGNSYTLDSFMYLPFILKEYEIDIQIGIYYRGGGSLQNNVDEWISGNNSCFYIDTSKHDSWQSLGSHNQPWLLSYLPKWDIVCIQNQSAASIDYSTFVPAARNLITLIKNHVSYPFQLAWNININRKSSGEDYTAIANQILQNIQNICNREPVDFIFPYGTGIFNARTNDILKDIGDGGNLWSSDNLHLQEGLPCYLACLTNVEAIFRKFYPQYSVLNNKTRPTDELLVKWATKGRNGTCTGITEDNCFLAQIAAIQANNNKFTITNIN